MNPHLATACEELGPPLGAGSCVAVLVHGRGQGPAAMRELAARLDRPAASLLIPTADQQSWYPESFLVPRERNEPRLGFGLEALEQVRQRIERAGVPAEGTVWIGFSQGACLILEHLVHRPSHYGGVVAFTGGLIGATREVLGTGLGLPPVRVVLGTSDVDEFVPLSRVEASADHLARQGAAVELHVFQGMGHEICDDEVELARQVLDGATGALALPGGFEP